MFVKIASYLPMAPGDPLTVGETVNTAFSGLLAEAWVVIPGGLLIFGVIYGLGVVKKAGKKAIS